VATYCYKCLNCEAKFTGVTPGSAGELNLPCGSCGGRITRDYRAEAVGFSTASLAHAREFDMQSHRDQFLPTPADYAGPDDPDGQKGLREWRESVSPKAGNKRPAEPDIDKKVW
jgi:hypothetical protein